MRWMRNSAGKPDAMLTAAMIALAILLAKVLLAGLEVRGVRVGPAPDPGTIGALLLPTFGAYWARRNNVLARPGEPQSQEKERQ